MKINSYFIVLLLLICGSCYRNSVPTPDKKAYFTEIETWRAGRLERLKSLCHLPAPTPQKYFTCPDRSWRKSCAPFIFCTYQG